MTRLLTLGTVIVHRGEPPESNPYRGFGFRDGEPVTHVSGAERVEALRAFRDGGDAASEFSFWHAPTSGAATRLDDPAQVDWAGLR